MVITFTGAYATNNSIFDLVLLLILGVFAYFISKFGYSMAPLAVGLVLGSTIETGLVQGLIICNGNFLELMSRPIAGSILAFAIVLVLITFAKPIKRILMHSKES